MPRFILLLVSILVAGSYCWANDGAFYGASGVLKPQKNTRISIQREWLSFDLTKEHAEIRVRFHFFNPDDTAIALPVGFYVPRGSGDVGFEDIQHPAVDHFTTMLNGKVLPYELKIQRCDTCSLEDTAIVFATEGDPNGDALGSAFVFLSNISFQPGVNVVTHSYQQRPNTSFAYPAEYPYIVSTASRWAGGTIDTLECEFTTPPDMMCFVKGAHSAATTHVFGSAREFTSMQLHPYWVGWDEDYGLEPDCARVKAPNGDMVTPYHCRLFRIADARVRFTWQDFRPTECYNFSFTLQEIASYIVEKDRELSVTDSSAERDRLLRNTLYAIHGLTFWDPSLQSYFDKQEWYIGDPNVRASSIRFNKDERVMLDLLLSRDNVSKP